MFLTASSPLLRNINVVQNIQQMHILELYIVHDDIGIICNYINGFPKPRMLSITRACARTIPKLFLFGVVMYLLIYIHVSMHVQECMYL